MKKIDLAVKLSALIMALLLSANSLCFSEVHQNGNESFNDEQVLEIFKIFLRKFEDDQSQFWSERSSKIGDRDAAEAQIKVVRDRLMKEEDPAIPLNGNWGEVQEYKDFFYQVHKNKSYYLIFLFCEKNGDRVFVAKFAPGGA